MNFHFKIKRALYKNMETVISSFLGFEHIPNETKHSRFAIQSFSKTIVFPLTAFTQIL